ncbi:hypothetical protein LTR91_000414 [Friedmanniomyces endolithicus]|uniref:Major facilitator superfamily (MFS) profile domain-containing protein n=1 Tax=Friedmanniomyces endolithicus TaxID=329885 RepID=A0AAN6FU14_9PEZI|nr:hypothetical protein LTR35_010038 [Friedmanniomyces endolithicus]KAK0298256.1 hypothetical protein LTS00_003221 [Friedmanniomyces endolithicus]KAK0323863.1 hypothetical protein LTR82_004983 [Friedmanniomyces endolithicus]KAK0931465.1 hypothetical protein LTR57_000880 [Friedmanniomyces endolithicus]KAK1010742.1 hypothetical protein LTS01_001434 [Friedmanniomyces endolithicus]
MSVHHGTSYQPLSTEEDVDSAATTLRASASSSKAQSLDEGRRRGDGAGAGIELEGWKGGGGMNKRVGRGEGGERGEEASADDGDEAEAHEDEHLLHTNADATFPLLTTIHSLDSTIEPVPLPLPDKPRPVSWSSLPSKGQLAILTLSRLSEPLTQTSLQAYMFYQLKSFHAPGQPPPTDSTVAQQAGILAAAFTGAQMLTAVLWGRLADDERMGRKKVILIGLLGSAIGSLGFGFSSSFATAVLWRAVGGMLNGNMGVMRTMISEIVLVKKFQSRAFLLLPMTFNVGVIIGPLLGGLLADPVGSYPGVFGEGYEGWMARWPYALPNVVNAGFLVCSALGVLLGLEETLEGLRGRRDWGLRVSGWVSRKIFRRKIRGTGYEALTVGEGEEEGDIELAGPATPTRKPTPPLRPAKTTRRKLPFRRIFTPNVLFTLLAHGLLAMHVGTFNQTWFVFLSTPRYTPDSTNNDHNSSTLHLPPNYHPHPPFTFTGGLALPPPSIGTALAILGVIGITLQLLLYPPLSFHLGTLPSYRLSLLLFPFSYTLTPFLAVLPSSSPAPNPASGFLVWAGITAVLALQTLARTFALPATAILVNNSSPHPSVLGTVHGIAQTVSSATRTVGPVVAGWAYGVGLENGVVGLAWWGLAGVAVVGAVAGRWVREGSGWEVFLEGEEGAREEREREELGTERQGKG